MPNKNKNISKKSEQQTVFPENQVMMMLESMNGGIEILAEGQQQLIQNQNELKDNLENFKVETRNNFKKVNTELKDFKIETRDNFKKHDKKFKQIDKNFAKVFKSLDEIKQEIKDIRRELNELEERGVDNIKREEFEKLVKRVEVVENFRV